MQVTLPIDMNGIPVLSSQGFFSIESKLVVGNTHRLDLGVQRACRVFRKFDEGKSKKIFLASHTHTDWLIVRSSLRRVGVFQVQY